MDRRFLVLIGVLLTIGIMIILLKGCLLSGKKTEELHCQVNTISVNPRQITFGSKDSFFYSSTFDKAKKWQWDFGDGSFSKLQYGKHFFSTAGRHLITCVVNDKCPPDTMSVWVNEVHVDTDKVKVVIEAPASGFAGRPIHFKSSVPGAKEWLWKFGQSGVIDSKEQNPTYSFKYPGDYTVILVVNSDIAKKPGTWPIKILPIPQPSAPRNNKATPAPKAPPSKDDIKNKLQAIADSGLPDFDWIHKFFANGSSTPVKFSPDKDIKTMDDLLTEFSLSNGQLWHIEDVKPEFDTKTSLCKSILIKASRKK